jgi:DNA-binding transcriptional LysR family regulator
MTSRYVAGVEKRLGVRLLHRTTRRISLTEAGRDYYQRAVEVIKLVDHAESAAGQAATKPRGTIRMAAPTAFGRQSLGPLIEEYLREFPDVALEVSLNDRFVDLVEEGIDLAIRVTRQPDSHLVARLLARAHMIVCASPMYLKAHGTPKSPEDLAKHNCLTRFDGGVRAMWKFARDSRSTTVQVSGNFRGNNGELLMRAAIAGLGIVYEPTFIVGEALRAKKLVQLLPAWQSETYSIYAVYANREYLPAKVRSLIDFLAQWFERNPAWDAGLISRN